MFTKDLLAIQEKLLFRNVYFKKFKKSKEPTSILNLIQSKNQPIKTKSTTTIVSNKLAHFGMKKIKNS